MNDFRFKQFAVRHKDSAMKVGTDGVLLGAWANINSAQQICDVGTGTGLIALMAAQRNESATITAIELDSLAAKEASYNVSQSPWSKRISTIHGDYQQVNSLPKQDAILCNPPYFQAHKTINENARKTARQQTAFDLLEFFTWSKTQLHSTGKLSFIYPYETLQEVKQKLTIANLHIHRICYVRGKSTLPISRCLIEVGNHKLAVQKEELVIEHNERHQYTKDYKALTEDFYL